MRTVILILALCLFLAGCATKPAPVAVYPLPLGGPIGAGDQYVQPAIAR